MFASQLLRILQTMPSDVKYETRVFDPDERSSSMKGGRNSKFGNSESFPRENESISFGNRRTYQKRVFDENCQNEYWSAESVKGFSKDPEGGRKDSDKSWRSGELECSMMVEEPKHQDSGHILISASSLITDADDVKLDFDLPELEVCYKETNYQVVCADVEENVLIESMSKSWDGFSDPFLENTKDKSLELGSRSFLENSIVQPHHKEEIQAKSMLYRSRVERRSITFNFNSPILGVMIESQGFHEQENLSETSTDDSSSTGPVHFIINNKKGHETSPDRQDTRSLHISTDFTSMIPTPPNTNGQVIQYDEVDSGHSSTSFIVFSGPIAYSGSLSLRSDGSATSTTSFAFPVLHSEGNRSPVKMEDTDLGHFQRLKDWRSGLLCCRF